MVVAGCLKSCYLADFDVIDSKFCVGVRLLCLEDLLDGDGTQRVATSALQGGMSHGLPEQCASSRRVESRRIMWMGGKGKGWTTGGIIPLTHCRDLQIHRQRHLSRRLLLLLPPLLHRSRRRWLGRVIRTMLSSMDCTLSSSSWPRLRPPPAQSDPTRRQPCN